MKTAVVATIAACIMGALAAPTDPDATSVATTATAVAANKATHKMADASAKFMVMLQDSGLTDSDIHTLFGAAGIPLVGGLLDAIPVAGPLLNDVLGSLLSGGKAKPLSELTGVLGNTVGGLTGGKNQG